MLFPSHTSRVCMFVYNNFLHDSRVQREAKALIRKGYWVMILALLDGQTTPIENRDAIKIIRVDVENVNPLYRKILSARALMAAVYFLIFFWLLETLSALIDFDWQIRLLLYGLLFALAAISVSFSSFLFTPPNRIRAILTFFHSQYRYLSFYLNAYKITKGERIGVYHAHDLNTLPVAYLVAKRDKAQLIYDSHELFLERNKLKPSPRAWVFVLRHLECFLARRAHAVVTVNESLAREMVRRYGIVKPYVVMNTPSRSQKNKPFYPNKSLRDACGIPSEFNLLIYVGAITFNRGLEELILSLKYLEDASLVFLGYGNVHYKKSLVNLAEKAGVVERLHFFGPVPSEEVIYYASEADLGVAPIANACLSYYYCSPNKIFEYMNAGLPVIASDFPELRKVIFNHDIGLVFDPSNPKDIASKAKRILNDNGRREYLRQKALEACSLYNWEKESRKLLKIYSTLSNSIYPQKN